MADKENPQTSDDVLHVKIAYDMRTGQCTMTSKCPTIMLFGILEVAKSIVIQNQTVSRIVASAAASGDKPAIVPATAGQMPH